MLSIISNLTTDSIMFQVSKRYKDENKFKLVTLDIFKKKNLHKGKRLSFVGSEGYIIESDEASPQPNTAKKQFGIPFILHSPYYTGTYTLGKEAKSFFCNHPSTKEFGNVRFSKIYVEY